MSQGEKIIKLARFMHETYEELSEEVGWDTQQSCRVDFLDLPEKNKKVMIGTALAVVAYIKEDLEQSPRIISSIT